MLLLSAAGIDHAQNNCVRDEPTTEASVKVDQYDHKNARKEYSQGGWHPSV
jgi:hypothetical protein